MDMYTECVWMVYLFVAISLSNARTWTEVKTALSTIQDESYDVQSLRPVDIGNDTLEVFLDLNVASLNDFDETNGYLEIGGYLTVSWTPSGPAYPVGVDATELIDNSRIWKPPILLVNSLTTAKEIGSDTSTKIRLNFGTLQCEWKPWIIVRGACTPNVKYYPFDEQSCLFKFAVWGYTYQEVILTPKNSEWTFLFFEANGEWDVLRTSSDASVVNNISVVEFKIDFTRRPLYYVINLLAPVIILGIVNVFVFLLPVDSGERIGFSVTCFLAYVVMLNTIMDYLPTSAVPLSYLSYYTFVMMMFSAGMSLATILTIRVHRKSDDDKIPSFLKLPFNCFRCKCCDRSNRVQNIMLDSSDVDIDSESGDIQKTITGKEAASGELTWKKIAHVLDWFLFVCFLGGQIFYSVAYVLPIVFNA